MSKVYICEYSGHKDPVQAGFGLRICDGCVVALRRDLSDLYRWYPELVEESVSGTGPSRASSGFVTGTPDNKLHPEMKYNRAAADCADQIRHDVLWIVENMTKERYGRALVLSSASDANLGKALRWLEREVYWIAGSEYGANLREVCRGLMGQAMAILDPAGRPVEVGACTEYVQGHLCSGTIFKTGEGGASRLRCNMCGFVVPFKSWGRYGQRVAKMHDVEIKGDIL